MDRPVRILLIGAGRMGLGHLEAIQKMPELASVVAGVDPSPAARERLKEQCGIPRTYAELEPALREEEVDAVFVCAPNFLHAQYALAALGAGKHAFVEKPMALDLEDVDRMVGAAHEQGCLLMSGQSQRFVPHLRYAKKLIEEGTIGKVRHVLHRRLGSSRGGDERSWFAKQALSGGILPGIGSHSLDILLWWLGERAKSVYALVQNIDPHPEVDIEDEVSLVATTESGAMLNVALSFHHQAGTEWIAAGTRGVIHLRDTQGELRVNGEKREVPAQVALPGESSIQREFVCAIREERPLAQAAGRQVRESLALIFAAQESGRAGRPVMVR
jgi:myo-inositol 2-dehydrogenase/D-chiro-inositol 1-dehydrogenase